MPVNVRRFCTSVSLLILSSTAIINAQIQASTPEPAPQPSTLNTIKTPSAAEVMRERITKAKANIAVRNYPAALYELENIKRETTEPSVTAVVNVLMMNSYIEHGDYKRAEDLLKTYFESYKRNNANADIYYHSVAAQVIKSARNQVDRYRLLGLTVSDRSLPLEAVNDIERMRVMVETVVEQAKETSADKSKATAATALLEEAMATRSAIARDDYDARRWRDAAADAREQMASSQSIVINATDGMPLAPKIDLPATKEAVKTPPIVVSDTAKTPESVTERPVRIVGNPSAQPVGKQAETKPAVPATTKSSIVEGPMTVGSLIDFAARKSAPNYPAMARSARASGVVRIDIVVDENGDVAEIKNITGHSMLHSAARDAIRRWKFKPFSRDGQPVRATGFINFNFTL